MSGFAGALRALVTLQRRAPDRDVIGGAAGEWIALGDLWAGVTPLRAADAVAGEALSAMPRWRVVLRAGSGAAVGDRLAWRGALLSVRGVTDDPTTPDRTILETEEER